MTKLEKIQRISKVLRYVVITTAVCIFTYVAVGLLFFGQWWAAIGNSDFNQLWESQTISHGLMGAVIAPSIIIVLLDVYWLQRLFGSYHRAEFFTDNSMRCYLWLVWLKVASFVYGICWPLILNALRGGQHRGQPGCFHQHQYIFLLYGCDVG